MPAADRFAVGPVELGMIHRVDDLDPDLFLDRLHPADVIEREAGPVDVDGGLVAGLAPRRADASLDDFARIVVGVGRGLVVGADPEPFGELAIGDGRVGTDAPVIVPYGLLDLAGRGRAAGRRARTPRRRRIRPLDQSLEDDDGQAALTLLQERVGQSDLQVRVLGSQRQRLAKLGLRQRRAGPAPAGSPRDAAAAECFRVRAERLHAMFRAHDLRSPAGSLAADNRCMIGSMNLA